MNIMKHQSNPKVAKLMALIRTKMGGAAGAGGMPGGMGGMPGGMGGMGGGNPFAGMPGGFPGFGGAPPPTGPNSGDDLD